MNTKNPILSELETLAPILINVPKTIPYAIPNGYFDTLAKHVITQIKNSNQLITSSFSIDRAVILMPFAVPENYFDSFAATVLAKIKLEKNEPAESIIPSFTESTYKVPSGYFNNLSNQIFEKIKLLENKKYVSFEKLDKITPYSVPFDYFENLSSNILSNIKESENEGLAIDINFTKTSPYKAPIGYFEGLANEILLKVNPSKTQDVPDGYFSSLPNIILQKVRALEVESELEEIAPLLNTINKSPINHIPVGYFETLQSALPQIVSAKVIGIKKKINWFKNAIAACLIGTLGFTAYQLMDNASTTHITSIQTASNEAVEIKLPTGDINVDEELSKVDDTSIAKYLDNIEMPTEQATAHFNDVNSGDVDAALQDIPDETIQQHLDETGSLVNKKN